MWNHVSCQKIVQWLVQVRPRAMAFEEEATKMKVFGEVESLQFQICTSSDMMLLQGEF